VSDWKRSEVEEAWRHFVAVGDAGDWNAWASVVYYPWQVLPDPTGGSEVHRFGCVTILDYAGDGLWSLQEDFYNPKEAEAVLKRWLAAGGRFAS
jgi:hypothetical protein